MGSRINMSEFCLDDILLERSEKDALVHESPSLAGYLIDQVMKGRSTLVEKPTGYWVFRATMDVFEEQALREGAESFVVCPERSSDEEHFVMRMGKHLIKQHRVWPNYGGGDTDTRGPAGIVSVDSYESFEEASSRYKATKDVLGSMWPNAVVVERNDQLEDSLVA